MDWSSVTAKGTWKVPFVFLARIVRKGNLKDAMLFHTAFLHLMVALSAHVRVSSELSAAMGPMLVLKELKRGTVLVNKGSRLRSIWFVHNGSVKEVTPLKDSASSRVSWFWTRGELVFYYPGFFAGEPAAVRIELLEDIVVLEMAYSDLLLLAEKFSEVPLLIEKIRAHHEKLRAAHAMDLVSLNARERYQKFFAAHKGLFNVARHKDIASFLGIRDDGFHRYQ